MNVINESCHRCTLSASHPMARLDSAGLCAPCRREEPGGERDDRRRELYARMESLFARTRSRRGTRVLLAYSGGKDSSWTLLQLRRRFGLNVRALTLDNGFLSETASANAARLTSALGAEHVVVRPPFEVLRRLFSKALSAELFPATALTRASSVCNACIAVVKSICLREALAHGMDIVVWGWSPGQAPLSSALFQPSRDLVAQMVDSWRSPLERALGEGARELSFDLRVDFPDRDMPHFVSPLALMPASETQILSELEELGWTQPRDVDSNSTNCRLNALASHQHELRHSFHPYALETAGLVRAGLLDPEVARIRMGRSCDPAELTALADELNLDGATRRGLRLTGKAQPLS